MTDIKALIARVRELDKAATPGPWVNDCWTGQCNLEHEHGRGSCKYNYRLGKNNISHHYISRADEPIQVVTTTDEYGALGKNDGSLIAQYRTAAPLLAEALEIALVALEHIYQIDEDPGIEHIAKDALDRIAKLEEK